MREALRVTAPPALRIGVVFGGTGPEHEASLANASAALTILARLPHQLVLLGIAKDGSWLSGPTSWHELYNHANLTLLPDVIVPPHLPLAGGASELHKSPPTALIKALDCVIPLVDGIGGEDGQLQELFETNGVAYTGCSSHASARAFNKWNAKQLAASCGIAITPSLCVGHNENPADILSRIDHELASWDLVIKPVASGSSFGVSRVTRAEQIAGALLRAFEFGDRALVEHYVPNVEVFVGVSGCKDEWFVGVPVADEPVRGAILSYHDKYKNEGAPLRCPTGLGADIETQAREMGLAVYNALGCDGFARIDLFYDRGKGRLLFNEANTIPALTPSCAFPTSLAAAGLQGKEFLQAAIAQGMRRLRAQPSSLRAMSTEMLRI